MTQQDDQQSKGQGNAHGEQQAAQTFVESMGLSAQADGLPRIAGRMWGFFILYGGPVSFADLAAKLQVSRGSISTNARILRDLGFIERVARPGDRQDYYRLADEPYDRLLQGYVERMRKTGAEVERAQRALSPGWENAQKRLAEMREFYHAAADTTEALVDSLRNKRLTAPSHRKT